MALTYILGFVPKWYIADLVGKPLGGGYLVAYSSINHTTLNLIFQDPAGLEPWPLDPVPNTDLNGILFDENGSQGPFYFLFNTATPAVTYYLEVYDSNGILQWTMDDYIPPNGGSGGDIITTNANLNNIIINSPMWRMINQNNVARTAIAPGNFQTVALSSHAGFANNLSTNPATSGVYTGPNIVFLKNSTGETDSINFQLFPLGVNTLSTDVTPLGYFNYSCSAATSGTVKCIQVPITRNVQNLSQKTVTISFWARCNSGAATITTNWFQFFGDGAASTSAPASFNVFNITAAWAQYTVTIAVPSVVGKTLGLCGNDALFLQFQYPLGQATNIDFTLPRMYLGNIALAMDYQSNDSIEAIIDSPRTGNVKAVYNNFPTQEYGWLAMNDGTIGQTGSGATNFAGSDCFPLYNLLYANVANTWAPVTGGRSGNAVTDFLAGKTMTLPKALGRALCEAGLATGSAITTWALGQNGGTQTPSIALNQLPQHTHLSPPNTSFITNVTVGGGQYFNGPTGAISGVTGGINGFTSQAGFDVTQPSTFMNFLIKL